jgi:phospholipid/cholesterol/gamma-HCH transport system permease protein
VAIPFGVTISIQVGSLASQVGAASFMGAANGLAAIREGAPMVTALLLAGAAGSAICSDLAARTIREEVDAIKVMGLSPVRLLVVPRVAATVFVGFFLVGVVAFTAIATGYVFNIVAQHGTAGSYVESFAAFAQAPDLILAVVKAVIFSFIAAVVASYKGLAATGGPKGVAQAVNASVVLSVVLLFIANLVITQVYAVYVPQRIV